MARKPRKNRNRNPNHKRHRTHGGQSFAHKVGKEMRIAEIEKDNIERNRKIARYHRQCDAQFRADYHALRLTYLH